MAHPFRTRFSGGIVAEFLPPARKQTHSKAIILCDGAPSLPYKKSLMEFLSRKGYWVIYPRYRGAWESEGTFLEVSPEEDVRNVINGLHKGFKDVLGGKTYHPDPEKIFIIANSFGGPAGILASRDPRVSKVIAIAPVVDWKKLGPEETMEVFVRFTGEGFGKGYRGLKRHWKKLARGNFYSPIAHAKEIDGGKVLIFQAQDDGSVPWRSVAHFSRITHSTLKLYKRGGHLGMSGTVPRQWKKIAEFFRGKPLK